MLSFPFSISPPLPLRIDAGPLRPCPHREPLRPLSWLLARPLRLPLALRMISVVNSDPPFCSPPRYVSVRHIVGFEHCVPASPLLFISNAFLLRSPSLFFVALSLRLYFFLLPFSCLLRSPLVFTLLASFPHTLLGFSSPLAFLLPLLLYLLFLCSPHLSHTPLHLHFRLVPFLVAILQSLHLGSRPRAAPLLLCFVFQLLPLSETFPRRNLPISMMGLGSLRHSFSNRSISSFSSMCWPPLRCRSSPCSCRSSSVASSSSGSDVAWRV